MMNFKSWFLFVFAVATWFSAMTVAAPKKAEKKNDKQLSLLTEVLAQYRSSNALQLNTKRTIRSELLNNSQVQEGVLYLEGIKVRWEFSAPEKTVLIYDGKIFWNIQHPPAEFGGPVQVVKTRLNKQAKDHVILTAILGKEPLSKFFKFGETKEKSKNELEYLLSPLKDKQMGAKEVRITVNKNTKLITKVLYVDDVGNSTDVDITSTAFKSELKKGLFTYKPGPKDRVSEL